MDKKKLAKIRQKPGGSNVGKKTFANGSPRTGPYVGPSGGAPAGSYPIPDINHARAALALAHHAPNPEGIEAAVKAKYPQLKRKGGRVSGYYENGGIVSTPAELRTQSDTLRGPQQMGMRMYNYKNSQGQLPDYLIHNVYNQYKQNIEEPTLLDKVDNVLSAPQRAITWALTGKYQNPSEAMGIQNKWGKLAVDMTLDPMNLLGLGLAKKVSGAAKTIETVGETAGKVAHTGAIGAKGFDYARDIGKFATQFKGYAKNIDFSKYTKYNDFSKAQEYIKAMDFAKPEQVIQLSKMGAGAAIINDLIQQHGNVIATKRDEYIPHYPVPVVQTKQPVYTLKRFLKQKEDLPKSEKPIEQIKSISSDTTTVQQPEKKDIGRPESYWIGSANYKSYDELIKAQPQFKDPNLYYKTFNKRSPADSTGKYTKLRLKTDNYIKGGWIQGAVNPAHKGFCTPMTKSTCTPRRKALARTLKKMAKNK